MYNKTPSTNSPCQAFTTADMNIGKGVILNNKFYTKNIEIMKKSFFSNGNQTFWYVGYASQEPNVGSTFTEIVKNDTGETVFTGVYSYTGFKQYVETDGNGYDIYMYHCEMLRTF